jgi:3-oxoadipate enol-lactonase
MWEERSETVRIQGTAALADATAERWFTPEFRAEHPDEVAWVMDMLRATPDEGYAGCCAALARFDATDELPAVRVPTLVVAGAEDPTSPPSVGEEMVATIPEAELVVIEDAAHITNVARPEAFNAAIRAHLEKHR